MAKTLTVVVVCPSKETNAQAIHFKKFLEAMLITVGLDSVEIVINPVAPNYSSFEDVRDALEGARELAVEKAITARGVKVRDRDICIDVTSGTVPFSVAASIVTLNHDMVFTYVSSIEGGRSPRGGEVRLYDAIVDFAAFVPET